jgi:hypothetical protein
MDMLMSLLAGLLFFLLTPGILVTLPTKGSKITVALVHAVIFALIYYLTYKVVSKAFYEEFSPIKCKRGETVYTKKNKLGNILTQQCITINSLPRGEMCSQANVCKKGCNLRTQECV